MAPPIDRIPRRILSVPPAPAVGDTPLPSVVTPPLRQSWPPPPHIAAEDAADLYEAEVEGGLLVAWPDGLSATSAAALLVLTGHAHLLPAAPFFP